MSYIIETRRIHLPLPSDGKVCEDALEVGDGVCWREDFRAELKHAAADDWVEVQQLDQAVHVARGAHVCHAHVLF